MDSPQQPPPSYNDTTSATPHLILRSPPFAALAPPHELTSHYINVVPHAAPTSFPYPEPAHLWLSRDVRREDWASFVANLLAGSDEPVAITTTLVVVDDKKQPQQQQQQQLPPPPPPTAATASSSSSWDALQRMYGILAEWNAGFFAPRGLKVVAGGAAPLATQARRGDTSAAAGNKYNSNSSSIGKTASWKFGGGKFGYQIGNVLLGLDLSSASSSSSSPSKGDASLLDDKTMSASSAKNAWAAADEKVRA